MYGQGAPDYGYGQPQPQQPPSYGQPGPYGYVGKGQDGQTWDGQGQDAYWQDVAQYGWGDYNSGKGYGPADWKGGMGKGQEWAPLPPPPPLRFSVNDHVLCNCGDWRLGKVVECDFETGGEVLPYGVKLFDGNLITVPCDEDDTCQREAVWSEQEWKLTSAAVQNFTDKQKSQKLRFAVEASVAFRVRDTPDGFDHWLTGTVTSTWSELPDGKVVPYKLKTDCNQVFYCHRDEHTLIRSKENVPQERIKTMALRMEKRKRADGTWEKFDHVTGRGRPLSTA